MCNVLSKTLRSKGIKNVEMDGPSAILLIFSYGGLFILGHCSYQHKIYGAFARLSRVQEMMM